MILLFQVDEHGYSIDLPMHLSEVKFSDFCDFKAAENAYWEINKEADPEDPEPVSALLRALKCVVRGDLEQIPFAGASDSYSDLIETGYQLRIGDEISILRIYAHLVVLVQEYKPETIPETLTLSWLGNAYTVHSGPTARILSGRYLTTGEAIEVLEYQRRAGKAVEATPGETGNIEFTLGLTEFAILVRREGEKLPSDRKELTRFINGRQKIFSGLPLDRVMDLRFFLLNALVKSRKTQITGSSGTDLRAVSGSKNRTRKRNAKKWRGKPGT